MVYDGILIGLIVGLIRAGWKSGLTALSQIQIRDGWIFPVLLIVQFVLYHWHDNFYVIEQIGHYNNYIYLLVYAVGLYVLWRNRNEKGFGWIFAGVALNFLVMLLNGGKMPVSLDVAASVDPVYLQSLTDGTAVTKHIALDSSTYLPYLGDIIPVTAPYPIAQVISIGDIVMNFGIFIYLQNLMVTHKWRTTAVNSH